MAMLMPFLSIVRIAAADRRRVTNRFSSGNQKRFSFKLGRNRRLVQPVIFNPIPFFFFAIPRNVYLRPKLVFLPVRSQLLDIELPKSKLSTHHSNIEVFLTMTSLHIRLNRRILFFTCPFYLVAELKFMISFRSRQEELAMFRDFIFQEGGGKQIDHLVLNEPF
jgi:hypothetical protein